MKKLDDIPKKNIFNVPDGYFDKLPTKIQSRINESQGTERTIYWMRTLRLATSVILVLLVAGIFWYNQQGNSSDALKLLSSVDTSELISYLSDSDLLTEELLEDFPLDEEDVNSIESSVYHYDIDDSDIDELLIDIDEN